jgi:hypothetical protein
MRAMVFDRGRDRMDSRDRSGELRPRYWLLVPHGGQTLAGSSATLTLGLLCRSPSNCTITDYSSY